MLLEEFGSFFFFFVPFFFTLLTPLFPLDRLDSSGVHNGFFFFLMFANRSKSLSRVVKLSNLKSVNYISDGGIL